MKINTQKVFDSLFIDSRASTQCVVHSAADFDLSKNTYLAVFAGVKPSGGYAIKIQAVKENDCEIVVEYYEKSPKPGEVLLTLAISNPLDYAVIPKTTKPVVFKKVNFSGDYIVIGTICLFCAPNSIPSKYRIDATTTARIIPDNLGGSTYQNLVTNGDLFGFLSNVPEEIKALKGQTKEYIDPQIADGGACYFEYHQEGVTTKITFTNYSSDKFNKSLVDFQNYIYKRIQDLNKAN